MAAPDFLDVARRIGARLLRSAETDPDGITWTVMAPDRSQPGSRVPVATRAGGTLYEGTSGIALFLAELYRITADDALLPALEGALRHAAADGARLPASSFGFHAGRVGIAHALVRAGEVLDQPAHFRRAEAVLAPLRGHEAEDRGVDVIGGAAGAIPALLRMAGRVDAELARGMAVALGDHLLADAERETGGWSWGTLRGSSARHLCGYAHGAAGPGHALLELWAATGDGRYRYAAEQAFVYERGFASAAEDNWPDLRHTELGEYLYSARTDELRELLRAGGTIDPYTPRYMSAWCHGAPGIGLSRLRAWELTGEESYRDEAEAAVRATLRSLDQPGGGNYSLCHGLSGNSETLLEAARLLGRPELRERAERCAREGRERFEDAGRPWPCGTLAGASDPGLLLGEAGIGLFFLRLHDAAVPSPLLVRPADAAAPAPGAGADGWRAMRRETVEAHFGRTLDLFRALGEDVDTLLPAGGPGENPPRADVEDAREALARRAGAAQGEHAELLADAFRLDDERYRLARTLTDLTRPFLEGLARPAEDEVRWREGGVALSTRARVVHGTRDWDAWLAAGAPADALPAPDDVFHLLMASGLRVGARRLSPFAALVLQAVEGGAPLDEVVDRVADSLAGDEPPPRAWLEERVREQLRQAYRAGMVDPAPAPAGAPA